jgi:hypothetical protein
VAAVNAVLWGLTGVLLGAFLIAWSLLPLWLARRARKAAQGQAAEATQASDENGSEAA